MQLAAGAGSFLSERRRSFAGAVVCEPRHPSWFEPAVEALLVEAGVARVAAGQIDTLAERARVDLQATGARPRRELRTGVDALTPSERRVAQMAAQGMSNPQIAQALFVTRNTIETHLRHIYQKLGIASRSQLSRLLQPPHQEARE